MLRKIVTVAALTAGFLHGTPVQAVPHELPADTAIIAPFAIYDIFKCQRTPGLPWCP
ncbi:MAG: hypothetical protein GX898_04650 [Corynebacterium sp.]|uniref:hypothetical protein n=1 Tax=uncultured Corynebacterium sp. TaxID=159447 RepID=UPI0017F77453|nr:hypothetical protein [uncultured Corynebacterium sp.]NLZ57585.1 hypothetical protein [Corynebacterium sp.]